MSQIEELYVISVHHPFIWYKPMRYICAAIRFFTKSFWNHTALLVKEDKKSLYVVEMGAKGIEMTLFDDWGEDKIIYVNKTPYKYDKDRAGFLIKIMLELRLKYDYRGTFWYQLLYSIGKWINAKFKTKISWMGFTDAGRAAQKFYCSELVGYIFNRTCNYFATWYRMAPNDVYEYMNEILRADCYYQGEAAKMPKR